MKKPTDFHLGGFQEPGNTKPILQALKYALKNRTIEQFGFFKFNETYSDYEFVQCKNLNSFNPNFFSSNDYGFYKSFLDKKIICLFHSHLIDSPAPSQLDIEISNSIGIPSFIFSIKSKNSFLFYPENHCARPLIKRIFIPYFQDCVTFVKDFYKLNLNINLSKIINNWSRRLNDSNQALVELLETFFITVSWLEIQHGDLIVFKPLDFAFFHLAVCCDESHYWHHPADRYPAKELLSLLDKNKVYKVYRYKGT